MSNYLRDDKGWPLSIARLKAAMGYKEWPDAGFALRYVGNVGVYCLPARLVAGRRKHRATAVCPDCGKHVPVGRLQQHLKVHKGV